MNYTNKKATTSEIVKTQHPAGFEENKTAAKQGGAIAGDARKALELQTGKKVVSQDSYLPESTQKKLKTSK